MREEGPSQQQGHQVQKHQGESNQNVQEDLPGAQRSRNTEQMSLGKQKRGQERPEEASLEGFSVLY